MADINIGQITEALNDKMDRDVQNIDTQIGSPFVAGLSAPSNTYEDLTLLASGETYTAPADGYFYFDKSASANNQYCDTFIYDSNDNVVYRLTSVAPASGYKSRLLVSALKGQKVGFTYTVAGATNAFRFIYAKGSESEAS